MVSSPLRIGVDASMLIEKRAGVGNYVFNLLVELVEMSSNVNFYLYSNRSLAAECRDLGKPVEHICARFSRSPLWMSAGLPPYFKRDRLDVFWGGNGYLPLRAPAGIATVVTIHDLVYHYAGTTMPTLSRWSRRVLQGLAISQATSVVAVSNATARQAAQHYRRQPNAVIHPRMDRDFLIRPDRVTQQAVKRKYQLPDTFYLSIGTMEPRKNLVSLLAAYAEVKRQVEVPPLILAGNRGWLNREIFRSIEQLAKDGSVRWLGFVAQEDMAALYSLANLFIYVPIYEGFGMPVREALLSGSQVMASDIHALREAGGRLPQYISPDKASITQALLQRLEKGSAPQPPPSFELSELEIGSAGEFMAILDRASYAARNRA